jgi:hypothetical protein
MVHVIIHHNVIDYEKFRTVFDFDAERRKRSGCLGGKLMRSTLGENDLFAWFEWDTAENAKKFIAAFETHEAFEWVGAVEEVRAFVLEDLEQLTV